MALDSQMAATVQSGCGKTEVIGIFGLVGGGPSIPSSVWAYADGVGGISNKVAQWMLDPPLDPPSRLPSREGWSSIFHTSGYANKNDSLGPPSPEGRQFFLLWW